MKRSLSTSIFALATILSSSAYAADINRGSIKDGVDVPYVSGTSINWTGVYVGGQIGYGNANHKLEGSESLSNEAFCSAGTLSGSTCVTKAAKPASCTGGNNAQVNEAGTGCTGGGTFHAAEAAVTNDTLFVAKDALADSASIFLDGLNSHGVFGGGTIGADIQRGHLLFGVFGDYNISGLKTTVGGTGSPDIDVIEEGDSWLVAARLGYLFGQEKRALLYALGGYGQTDVTYAGLGKDGGDKDVTFSGFVVGAGGEYALSQNLFLGIEYQHFFGGKETIASDSLVSGPLTFSSKLTDELDTDKVMLKLKLKLNGGVPNFTD